MKKENWKCAGDCAYEKGGKCFHPDQNEEYIGNIDCNENCPDYPNTGDEKCQSCVGLNKCWFFNGGR